MHIPKGDGQETRPIGMPTIEDKVLQRAVALLLEPIYEQDFKDFSYGFRPGRSAHEALVCIWSRCMAHRVKWISSASNLRKTRRKCMRCSSGDWRNTN